MNGFKIYSYTMTQYLNEQFGVSTPAVRWLYLATLDQILKARDFTKILLVVVAIVNVR